MSNASPSQASLDFWEFVACGICQLPFMSSSGPTIPFWLTECGHVVCNNHLNTDQSCSQCGAQRIQLIPLQMELEAPMANWFCALPETLESFAFATKFQFQAMATQVRHYKYKCQRQRALIERFKSEMAELKQENAALKSELMHSHRGNDSQQSEYLSHYESRPPLHGPGVNKKRDLNNAGGHDPKRPRTTSSPLSIGPERLTLPHDRQTPNFTSRNAQLRHSSKPFNDSLVHNTTPEELRASAASSRTIQQFTYKLPSTSSVHPPQLTHAQAPFRRTMQSHEQVTSDRSMGPPPLPQTLRQNQNDSRNPYESIPGTPSPVTMHRLDNTPVLVPFTPRSSRLAPASSGRTHTNATPQPGSAPQRFIPSNLSLDGGSHRTPFGSHGS